MTKAKVVVVGAGPHALALSLLLVGRDEGWCDDLVVIDPSGRWMGAWQGRFAAHCIDRLRSAAVHHPHPDPLLLRAHAADAGRLDELFDPYDLPASDLFDDFCDAHIFRAGLQDAVCAERVQRVEPGATKTLVHLASGGAIEADWVVLATNPVLVRLPPEAQVVERTTDEVRRIMHADEVDLRLRPDLQGRSIDVVGGGLTAVQIAIGASDRGARVRLLSRRPLVARQFDVEPGWLGPRELDRYRTGPHEQRRGLIDAARGGGSVPDGDLNRLAASAVHAVVDTEAAAVAMAGEADEVWFATGHRLDATSDPLLADLASLFPTPIHDGLPCLLEDLRWPGSQVHLMGGYVALTLGPASRNLWGARWAAQRIADGQLGYSASATL